MAKNGGKGGGKKGASKGKQKTQRKQHRMRSRAVNDVQLMNQGSIDVLNQQLQQAQEDYLRMMQTGQSVYGGAADAIRGIESPDFGAIASDLQGWLNGLSPELQGAPGNIDMGNGQVVGMPGGEAGAGAGYGGAIGAAAMAGLANDASRFGGAQQAAQREAVVGGRNVQDTLMQRMEDALQGYNDQLHGIMAQQPYQIESRLDDLRDQSIEQQLAKSKMAADKATSEMMADYFGSQLGGFGGGGGGGGGGNGGGGGGGGGGQPGQFTGGFGGYGGGPGTWGGNSSGGGGDAPGWVGKARRINQATSFEDIPPWLQNVYRNATGHNRWEMVDDRPRRAQIFRRTRNHVSDLWRGQQEQEGPDYPVYPR